jgi:hypothetical protein
MPMYNQDWESALRALQPGYGQVARPAAPGTTGNIAYAPGMMRGFRQPQLPGARELYQQANPGYRRYPEQIYGELNKGIGGDRGYVRGPQAPPMGYPRPPIRLGPPTPRPPVNTFLDALRRMIAARAGVAATKGTGGYARAASPGPMRRY